MAKDLENNSDNTLISESHEQNIEEDEKERKVEYMKKIVQASKLINMWPIETKTFWGAFWYHFKVCIITINCISFVCTFLIRIKMEFGNMDGIAEAVDFVTVFISATFRFLYVYVRREKYLHLVNLIHNKFIRYSLFPSKNKTSLDKHYNLASRIILIYTCFTFFWILQICLVPLIRLAHFQSNIPAAEENSTEAKPGNPYPIPINTYVPFDISTQPAHALFYLYEVTGFFIFGFIYLIVDSFWYMVILLTIGQFSLIKESLNAIAEKLRDREDFGDETVLEENELNDVEDKLKKCVKHHQFTREVVCMIDGILNPNILVDSLHAIISIAFILLDVTIAITKNDWNKIFYSLEYFITSIVHMFFFDWLGNELALKEELLAEAIYDIPWYKCPSQKNFLLLVTIQSKRPYRLTGGRMYRLSLEFFTSTIKAVFSYFTFLFQLRNGKPSVL